MVEVFKTNVEEEAEARVLRHALKSVFPEHRVSFDLEDCDRVMRVEGPDVDPDHIIALVSRNAYRCVVME